MISPLKVLLSSFGEVNSKLVIYPLKYRSTDVGALPELSLSTFDSLYVFKVPASNNVLS
jgi:hypothetical protein